jgi:hypothetical protein
MNRKKLAISLLAGLLILALAAAVGYAALPQAPGHIELSATQFDFGTVPNTGPVSHTFQVTNTGEGRLEITGVATSCGCTSAAVADDHLAPSASTNLTVTYDPLVHDGATGEYMRIVYVRSDDPDTPEASLTIHVTVVEP